MKILSFAAALLLSVSVAQAQFGDLLKSITGGEKKENNNSQLSDTDVADGLKEALKIGTENSVNIVSQVDGFYKNPIIKIPLPENVKKIEKTARTFGLGKYFDEFDLSINRAAEVASKEAIDVFWGAIKDMSFSDAKRILTGRDNEATLYFQEKTTDILTDKFRPIVDSSMKSVGVANTYNSLNEKIKTVPFLKAENTDLTGYVTEKALDGLFYMVAEEEKKIRENPVARVTDLLKKVFSK